MMNNLGILTWSIWDVVFRLWPVLLIAAGLEVLIGRRSAWGSLLALMLTLALTGGAIWLFSSGIASGWVPPGEEIAQPLDGATEAEVVIGPAVGTVHLASHPGSEVLITGVIYPLSGERISRDARIEGDRAIVSLESQGEFIGPFLGGWGGEQGWNLKLAQEVRLDLDASIGIGQSEVDLTGLTVDDLEIGLAIGHSTVTLPKQGRFQAIVDGGIGALVVIIPAEMEARIDLDTGLVVRNLPPSYEDSGENVYTSPGYAGAEDRVDLHVNLGIGSVTVRHARGR